MNSRSCRFCILGAGPAGLGAACELTAGGADDIVILDRNDVVGGLSRTEVFGGARFDIGPHRFFTKSDEVNALWHGTLGDDFRPVKRLTRIYYKNEFFNYPLKPFETVFKLGPLTSVGIMLSFAASRFGSREEPETFEDWVTQNFGRKLFETFFKTYTEKVWGIPCNQIGAQWAAQRIKGLNVGEIIRSALPGGKGRGIKTLADVFDYPVLGAGQMYEGMCEKAVGSGAEAVLGTRIRGVNIDGDRVRSIEIENGAGNRSLIEAQWFLTSIPLTHFFKMVQPVESPEVLCAAGELYFRDHITVHMLIDGNPFPDQWIYVHSPEVKMARMANYSNFSTAMAGDTGLTPVSVEYFVFKDDDIWQMTDEDLEVLAADELLRMGLVEPSAISGSWVVRETECYPTYYLGFTEHYDVLKSRFDQFTNLYPIGRAGLYKYNNQDHSVMSGILAARNCLGLPGSPYNLWDINIDAEYHESGARS